MKTIRKAIVYVGKVVELFFGRDFPTPRELLARDFPYAARAAC